MTFIVGHKNPDTDSVTSAIVLSDLKNKLRYKTIPCILGNLNKETKYVLDYFNIANPQLIENVKTQITDLDYDKVESIDSKCTILSAYKLMESKNIRTLPIVDDENALLGIVTMKDIAMYLIQGDFYHLDSTIKSISHDLKGEILVKNKDRISGKISIVAFYYDTLRLNNNLDENSIVLVGDRYDIIDYAIEQRVQLLIVTGGKKIPNNYLEKAAKYNVGIILVKDNTYTISKLINQCNFVSIIMKKEDIVKFNEKEYLEDIKEELTTNKHSYYPIVSDENEFLGFISRRHVLNPSRKKVILVDHNEYSQSVQGLNEAEILEIVDHHKIGDITTNSPINFTNIPVGSTCTIIYRMYLENNIEISYKVAGLLASGIISDTLFLKSPTTTELDKRALEELNKIININLEEYAMNMFKAGSSLEGQSIEEIFFKDFKEFNIGQNLVGIGQVFTLDIEEIFNKKEEYVKFINKVYNDKKHYLTLLLVTDILKEGSYLLYKCDNNSIIPFAFKSKGEQGVFIEGIVSRKKQVIPRIIEALNVIK